MSHPRSFSLLISYFLMFLRQSPLVEFVDMLKFRNIGQSTAVNGDKEDDLKKSAVAYVENVFSTIQKGVQHQPIIFDHVVEEEWKYMIKEMKARINYGYYPRRVECRSLFPEILERRLRRRKPLRAIAPTAGFQKDHRSDMIDGEECIEYTGAQKGEINRRRRRLKEILGTTERRPLKLGSLILYVWTLSYLPELKFPGLGKFF